MWLLKILFHLKGIPFKKIPDWLSKELKDTIIKKHMSNTYQVVPMLTLTNFLQ